MSSAMSKHAQFWKDLPYKGGKEDMDLHILQSLSWDGFSPVPPPGKDKARHVRSRGYTLALLALLVLGHASALVALGFAWGASVAAKTPDHDTRTELLVALTQDASKSSPSAIPVIANNNNAALAPSIPPSCGLMPVRASVARVDAPRLPWAGSPAGCSVQGLTIEALTPHLNFRPRFWVGFTDDPEDKHHLSPWLLGARRDFSNSRRRIYVDFGGKEFATSVRWFMTSYPLHFDEMHVFEVRRGVFKVPPPGEFKPEELQRVHVNEGVFVGDNDIEMVLPRTGQKQTQMNATRWILEELKAAPGDALIIKMDIEGAEWPLLQQWAESPLMGQIVDELFVEIHYGHATMKRYGRIWNPINTLQTRDEATTLLHNLRANGIYTHAWP